MTLAHLQCVREILAAGSLAADAMSAPLLEIVLQALQRERVRLGRPLALYVESTLL